MPVTISPGDTIVFAGDSITAQPIAWYAAPGGFLDQVNAAFPPQSTYRVTVVGPRGVVADTTKAGKVSQVTVINAGLSGAKIDQLDVAVSVAPYLPQLVVLAYGVNDCHQNTNPATFATTYDTKCDEILAVSSSPQILALNILCEGEQWAAGPVWPSTTFNDRIVPLNAAIATVGTALAFPVVDQRGLLLAWEAINNAPAPGVDTGAFCLDASVGVHPKYEYRPLMGTWAFAEVET